jgi:hypothetical protein
VLKKGRSIISDVTNIYHKRTHKFGIEVPKSWDEYMRPDAQNGDTLWHDAVMKEMNNVHVTFKIMNGYEAIPQTYQ